MYATPRAARSTVAASETLAHEVEFSVSNSCTVVCTAVVRCVCLCGFRNRQSKYSRVALLYGTSVA